MKYTKFLASTYKKILKPIMFLFDAEIIHDIFTSIGNLLGKFKLTRKLTSSIFKYENGILSQNIFGLTFENPVGLAAGFDYNARLINISNSVGFGFESFGTVTSEAYKGNKKPRLARLPKSQSLLVNKGFKSNGIQKILKEFDSNFKANQILGISIGATNSSECSTSNAQIMDILKSFKFLKNSKALEKISYLELNISCPNVLGSGSLANPKSLSEILEKIEEIGIKRPLFVKFPLEIEWEDAKELIEIMITNNVSAIIISNLLKKRDPRYFKEDELVKFEEKNGNFSGKPTFEISNELISKVYKEYGNRIKIIGVGGIFSAEDAYEKIKRGASLVQLISGMIFEGPQVVGEINKGLVELIEKDGYHNISEVIGSNTK